LGDALACGEVEDRFATLSWGERGFTTSCMITSYEVYFYFWVGFGLGETKLYQGVIAIREGVGCNSESKMTDLVEWKIYVLLCRKFK